MIPWLQSGVRQLNEFAADSFANLAVGWSHTGAGVLDTVSGVTDSRTGVLRIFDDRSR